MRECGTSNTSKISYIYYIHVVLLYATAAQSQVQPGTSQKLHLCHHRHSDTEFGSCSVQVHVYTRHLHLGVPGYGTGNNCTIQYVRTGYPFFLIYKLFIRKFKKDVLHLWHHCVQRLHLPELRFFSLSNLYTFDAMFYMTSYAKSSHSVDKRRYNTNCKKEGEGEGM